MIGNSWWMLKGNMVLCSECERVTCFIKQTLPFEDVMKEAFHWKKVKVC